MTKKARLALFVLAATVFNVVTTVLCATVLFLLYAALVVPRIPEKAAFVGFLPIFIAAFVLAFFIYRAVLKRYLEKHPLPGKEQP